MAKSRKKKDQMQQILFGLVILVAFMALWYMWQSGTGRAVEMPVVEPQIQERSSAADVANVASTVRVSGPCFASGSATSEDEATACNAALEAANVNAVHSCPGRYCAIVGHNFVSEQCSVNLQCN